MRADDHYYKETVVRIMRLIRQYPYAHLVIGTRAALAFYDLLKALTILRVRDPLLTAALITLPHRIKNGSIVGNEQIVKEIVTSLDNSSLDRQNIPMQHLNSAKTMRILRELDGLQDMVHALPYKVDLLSPDWFKVAQVSLFKAEMPVLMSHSLNEEKKADFSIYQRILDDLKRRGLINFRAGSVNLTKTGSIAKYRDIFSNTKRIYPEFLKMERDYLSHSGDTRKYQQGDKYQSLHVRRTLRNLARKKINADQVSRRDLYVNKTSANKNCVVTLALDHSWSMARSKKLHYAKDAAAGLVFAVKTNNDKMALIAFSDKAIIVSPPTKQYGLLIEQITRLRPENETNIVDTLMKSRTVFSAGAGCLLKHLIFITDGIPTSAVQDITRKELEKTILCEVGRLRKAGVAVSVICIRDELEENDSTLARKIASRGKGSFSLVRTQDLLNQVLRDYASMKSKDI